MTQDPMGFDAGDSNLYRYCMNESVVEIDPSGLQGNFRRNAGPEVTNGTPIGQPEKIPLGDGKFAKLTVRKGVDVKDGTETAKNTLAITISGINGADAEFIQFGRISAVQVYYKAKIDDPQYKFGEFLTSSGIHKVSTPENPNWFLDTHTRYDKTDTANYAMYYSRSFLHMSTKNSMTIYDLPQFPAEFLATEIKDPNVARIVYQASFYTIPTLEGKPIGGGVYWEVQYEASAPKFNPRAPHFLVFMGARLDFLNSKQPPSLPTAPQMRDAVDQWKKL